MLKSGGIFVQFVRLMYAFGRPRELRSRGLIIVCYSGRTDGTMCALLLDFETLAMLMMSPYMWWDYKKILILDAIFC